MFLNGQKGYLFNMFLNGQKGRSSFFFFLEREKVHTDLENLIGHFSQYFLLQLKRKSTNPRYINITNPRHRYKYKNSREGKGKINHVNMGNLNK